MATNEEAAKGEATAPNVGVRAHTPIATTIVVASLPPLSTPTPPSPSPPLSPDLNERAKGGGVSSEEDKDKDEDDKDSDSEATHCQRYRNSSPTSIGSFHMVKLR